MITLMKSPCIIFSLLWCERNVYCISISCWRIQYVRCKWSGVLRSRMMFLSRTAPLVFYAQYQSNRTFQLYDCYPVITVSWVRGALYEWKQTEDTTFPYIPWQRQSRNEPSSLVHFNCTFYQVYKFWQPDSILTKIYVRFISEINWCFADLLNTRDLVADIFHRNWIYV